MNFKSTLFLVLWTLCGSFVNGANILALLPIVSPSHHIWNSVLMHKLGELGHNVTILSVDIPKPNEKIPPTVHYIHLEKGYLVYSEDNVKLDINDLINAGPFQRIQMYDEGFVTMAEVIFQSKGFQTLLDYPNEFKFDLVIHDYLMGPYLLGFLHKFNYPPMVGVCPFPMPPTNVDFMTNHYFPAYVPYYSTIFNSEMNFWERLKNTLLFIYDTGYRRLVVTPKLDALARNYFPKDMPYLDDLARLTAVALVNSHSSFNSMEPLPPNVIEVGGLQIRDPNPLPKDLEEFMNKSNKPVVFFSFGTNMKGSDFSREQIRTYVNAMAELSQYNFMWKFDVKYVKEEIPKNVLVRKFFPQSYIIAHPKLSAFVTHCGGLSTHESVYYGVPMVGVPLFVDQHRNSQESLQAGIAVILDFNKMTTKDLVEAIKKVVEDPQIRANSKVKAKQFRDRPMSALDTAVWWIEYVLRNPNTDYLRSPALKLNIFQANSLDCLGFVLFIVILAIYLLIKLVSMVWRIAHAKKSKKIKKN